MLVEGCCANGHKFMCLEYEGHVAGIQAGGRIRDTCPECGGKPYVVSKSGVMPSVSKQPSVPPLVGDVPYVRETAPGPPPPARTGTDRSKR